MKTNFYTILILSVLVCFSCSKDNDENAVDQPPIQNDCGGGMAKTLYTECCVEGPIQAKSDQIISLTYTSNFESDIYEWTVQGNSITLVEGQNAATAKFRTAKNFVKDSILGFSISPEGVPACGNIIVITAY
ncbi:hypothetical protein Aeqsu_0536 [Aequorivita sublithincola DSM 14238]|uniref:Uncharacterized protein n=1 Tax=Aequorivita sublithincola (strain DSM 14238 / LMG 21431 / ACAM 643 / 9-3) TaxID=746697 RepID=I3YST0_AEQSU|nr:hypothetical protein [Aequorivita sublithincola]AFL80048.1 hypothetical protein Aeqsu_0536 [Aequorivita sublithincola DSM 14238]